MIRTLILALLLGPASAQRPLPPVSDTPFRKDVKVADGLTWHTDLEAALAEASARKKDVFVYVKDTV